MAMALALVLASGVALAVNKVGTDGPDTLRGTNRADNLLGMGGNDVLFGLGGGDNLLGGEGRDVVLGGNESRPQGGDKNLVGGPGNDIVATGKGSDNAVGGEGNDYLFECCLRESSKDTLSGGSGNDLIDVWHKPAFKDIVVCGDGFDYVLADPKDVVAPDCERVRILQVHRFSVAELFDQSDRFYESIPQSFFEALPRF
jgi:Ca2+-binding RTX toxin-like protein